MSNIGARFDSLVDQLTGTYRRLSDQHGAALLPVATLGACLGIYALSRPFEKRQLPRVTRAPELVDTEPYPKSIYGNTGRFLNTPYGRIRYYDVGPKDGKKLLLVHGISTPVPMWRNVVDGLIAKGHRLLMFDLWGRGYSDSPALPHDISLYVTQITLLLTALPEWDSFDIAGLSLGGPIVSNFVNYFPERVKKVILLCPAGATPQSEVPLRGKVMGTPLLPASLLKLASSAGLSPLPLPTDKKTIQGWQLSASNAFFYSFVSSLRYGPLFDNTAAIQSAVDSFKGRLLIIWGDDDTIVPMATSKYLKNAELAVIPGAGHYLPVTHPEKTLQLMVDFLAK